MRGYRAGGVFVNGEMERYGQGDPRDMGKATQRARRPEGHERLDVEPPDGLVVVTRMRAEAHDDMIRWHYSLYV